MKTNAEDKNYHPIQFALNRAVFHKEITGTDADKGIAEHKALLAVVSAAITLSNQNLTHFDGYVMGGQISSGSMNDLRDALTAFNALRN